MFVINQSIIFIINPAIQGHVQLLTVVPAPTKTHQEKRKIRMKQLLTVVPAPTKTHQEKRKIRMKKRRLKQMRKNMWRKFSLALTSRVWLTKNLVCNSCYYVTINQSIIFIINQSINQSIIFINQSIKQLARSP